MRGRHKVFCVLDIFCFNFLLVISTENEVEISNYVIIGIMYDRFGAIMACGRT